MPLGVLVRNRLDFALPTAGWCTATVAAVAAQFGFVTLFNNDASGRYLAIYAVTSTANTTSFPAAFVRFTTGSVGTLGSGLRPVILDRGAPVGQQLAGTNAAQQGTLLAIAQTSSRGDMLYSDQPLFVLPPNYSLIAMSNNLNLIYSASILYAPIKLRRR